MASTNDIAHAPPADTEFDALAELFLGDRRPRSTPSNGRHAPAPTPTAESPAPEPDAPAPSIDLVVLGHLPVRSGPWVARYAAERATRAGRPIALVRLLQGHITIDLIAPSRGAPAAGERHPTIGDALNAAAGAATDTILSVDSIEELDLVSHECISSITVLTGANEAAVVEAYRAVKALGAKVIIRADGGDEVEIRIGIMGADAEKADQAWRKLADASRAFIGRELQLAAVAEKIDPSVATNLFRGDTDTAPAQLVELIRDACPPEPEMEPEMEPEPAPQPAPAHVAAAPEFPRMAAPAPKPTASSDAPDPIALIGGLTPIALPCAPDPLVRAGRDAQGGLHLVRVETEESESAVAGLVAVEAWVRANRALIEMALGSPIAGDATVHLITPHAARAVRLAGSRIRVHALARATGPFAAIALN